MTNAKLPEMEVEAEEVLIDQDHRKGPGWFLVASYVVVTVFCLYYLFAYWNWKSDYDRQQEEVNTRIEQVAP